MYFSIFQDFYNIFAYVQSQYLFRLALLAIQNFSMNFLYNDLSILTKKIQQAIKENEKYFQILSFEKDKKNLIEISSLNRSIPYHQQNTSIEPAFILRDSSLKLSSCIYAVAEECQKLDNVLQKIVENSLDINNFEENETKNLMEISNSMKSIENSLSICCDDFHRLILVYNKFLSNKLKLELKETSVIKKQENIEGNSIEEHCQELINEEEKFDDFFAFINNDINDENSQNEKEEMIDNSNQIYDVDEKLTKKKFKPVLKQLRSKIDPIRQEMLEKERKILESKGIDVNKFLSDEIEKSDDTGSNDSDGSFEELEKERKKKNKKDNYKEMRQFLAEKDAINVFKLQLLPTEKTLSEDILE